MENTERSRRFPFPIPNCWFQIAWSDELAPGQVVPLRYVGRDLVLWRGEDGAARVFDAYCPHLGAHLGYGGKVDGTTIRCPFHGWRFGADGQCVEVPYAKRIPPRACLEPWHVCEKNGMVMLWHHAEGKPPQYEIPEVPEIGDPDWTPIEKRRWKIRSVNQEMGENAVDRAHFRFVHGTLDVPESETEFDGPCLRMVQKAPMMTPRGPVDGQIASTSYGFGFGLTRFTGIVETLLVGCTTPIDGESVDVRFSFTVRKTGNADVTRGVGRALIADIEKQMGEDIPIWENKKYLPRPVLCDGDGPIGQYRKWCEQFYSYPPESKPQAA